MILIVLSYLNSRHVPNGEERLRALAVTNGFRTPDARVKFQRVQSTPWELPEEQRPWEQAAMDFHRTGQKREGHVEPQSETQERRHPALPRAVDVTGPDVREGCGVKFALARRRDGQKTRG